MKKLFLLVLVLVSFNPVWAEGRSVTDYTMYSYSGKYYKGNRYQKGNLSPEQLPNNVKKYLKEYYPEHSILVCKKKGDGYYFVKIQYPGERSYYYYRSLVFDTKGKVVKG